MAVCKKDGKWRADFWLGGRGGRRVRKQAPTKALAEAYEREWKQREFRGNVLEESPEAVSLASLIESYRTLHENANAPSTRKRDELVFSHLRDVLGNPLIAALRGSDFEAYKAARSKQVSPATVNLELRVIRSLFSGCRFHRSLGNERNISRKA